MAIARVLNHLRACLARCTGAAHGTHVASNDRIDDCRRCACLCAQGGDNRTLLVAAARHGQLELVRQLLARGVDVDERGEVGGRGGGVGRVRARRGAEGESAEAELLECACAAAAAMQGNDTALTAASMYGRVEVVKFLLRASPPADMGARGRVSPFFGFLLAVCSRVRMHT